MRLKSVTWGDAFRAVGFLCLLTSAIAAKAEVLWPSVLGSYRPDYLGQYRGKLAEERALWHTSLKSRAPRFFVLQVSVIFSGGIKMVSSEFFVNKRGGMHQWVSTPRDTRDDRDRQLTAEELQRVQTLLPRLQVPVRSRSEGRVIVSFLDGGTWITCNYGMDALPAVLREIFQTVHFDDYGPYSKSFGPPAQPGQ